MNIGFDEHKYITLSELELYISMFNTEQEKKQEQEPNNKMPDVHM